MSKVKFKAGDLVYCPSVLPNVFKLLEVYDSQLKVKTPLRLVNIDRDIAVFLTSDGFDLKSKIPVIFHATQENYELLSKLYPNVEFEPPPKRKEPREIIKAMLESGKWFLVNYRGYGKIGNPPKNKTVTQEQFEKLDMNGYFDKNAYANVEVFCPNTGKTIIDFVNGEVVLESEND